MKGLVIFVLSILVLLASFIFYTCYINVPNSEQGYLIISEFYTFGLIAN